MGRAMKGRGVRPAGELLTPAGFASKVSGGKWVCPPHLDLLNRKLLDLAARRTRRLIVSMPPRHGKSLMCSQYFPAWYLGLFPDHRFVISSYGGDFAAEWGAKVRDILAEHGKTYFGVEVDPLAAGAKWGIAKHEGGCRSVGIGGALTGGGADVLLIDDPIKDAEEALSETARRKVWDWWISTAKTRLEPGGCVCVIMTRWHSDDLVGRLVAGMESGGEQWEVVNLPALAEEDDPLGRAPGEALWPERYSVADLEAIRDGGGDQADISAFWFDSLYQGRPVPKSGGMFQVEWFADRFVTGAPSGSSRCRFWDMAASVKKGDWTVGVLMARDVEGVWYVEDVQRHRLAPGDRDTMMRKTAEKDRERYGHVLVRGEEEGGASGKTAALAFVKLMAGFDVGVLNSAGQGNKEARARAFASQCQYGNVRLVKAPWNAEYIKELIAFPFGKHDDQVDASSGSFNTLANIFETTVAPDPFARYRGRTA